MKRRDFVLAACAGTLATPLLAAARGESAGANEIVLGQSAVFSGPLSPGALAMQGGVKLALEEANAKGGVFGRKLRLVALDDAFDPAKAKANYEALVGEHKVLACLGGVGALSVLAGLAVLREQNVPLVGASAVVDSAREKTDGIAYYTRASQQRESDALVQHLNTLGLQKIAMAHIATPGGQEVTAQVQAAAKQRGANFVGAVAVAPDGSNAAEAGKALAALQAQAVVMFMSGPAAATLMKAVWANGNSPGFYGMSILAGDVTARLLGAESRGLAISQVTPYPWDAANADANQYRKLCEKASVPVGYHSYEAYLSGRVLIDALRLAGRDVTREKLHAALRKQKVRVGGMDVDFSKGFNGTSFVELVRVRQDGKYVR